MRIKIYYYLFNNNINVGIRLNTEKNIRNYK